MKQSPKKVLAFLLAVLTVTAIFAACSGKSGSGAVTTAPVSDTEAETQKNQNPYEQDDKLPEMNMNGREMVYLTATEITGGELTVMDTEDSSDNLLASLYRRTAYVESRYHVDITDNRRPYGETYNAIYETATAGADGFDACYGFAWFMFPLTLESCFLEFSDIPYVDISAAWWDQNARESFSVADRLFFCTGDANMFYNDYTWVLFFNKGVLADIQEEEPYESVRNKTWTMDEMYRLGMKAVSDVDGNQTMDPATDRYGMVTHQYTANAMLYGCNELFFEKDKDDLPVITFDNERLPEVCDKVARMFSAPGYMLDTTGMSIDGASIEQKFSADMALFAGEVLQCARRYRGMETDFGILPYPMYDDSQGEYVSYTLEMVYPVGVTINKGGEDLTQVGIILEAMQSASHNSLREAYFDAALESSKYLRDTESGEMMQIIFDTRRYPFATLTDFAGVVNTVATNIRKNAGGYSSTMSSLKDKAQAEIEKTVEKIQDID